MYSAAPSRAERVSAASARLVLLCTLLLALSGQAAAILGVPLPGWEHAAILLDTLGIGLTALIRLVAPRPTRRAGQRRL